jgi:hypothetical protein
MATIKLMANNISNLTDARYFAAQMVDYLVFAPSSIDENAIAWMQEIKNWVVGPKWVLNGTSISIEEIELATIKINFDGICAYGKDLAKLTFEGMRFQMVEKVNLSMPFSMEIQGGALFIKGDLTTDDYNEIRSAFDIPLWLEISTREQWLNLQQVLDEKDGIILSGEEEKKVGYKSYDSLDLIFDAMDESIT